MTVISKEKKTFKHYEEMPSELRIMVIDEMEPKDRILFSTSSKLSNIEAKKSKNYIYSLRFCRKSDIITIDVNYGYNKETNTYIGFSLIFENCKAAKRKRLMNFYGDVMWQVAMDNSIDMAEYGVQHFKNLLSMYQTRIKKLKMDGSIPRDFEIKSLANLEKLSISEDFDILYCLEKTRKPLKKLEFLGGADVSQNPQVMEYVFNVRKKLYMINLKLNYEQFSCLRASQLEIHIGYLTERRIFDFIRSWQNDELGFEPSYSWSTENSNFRVRKLATLLGAPKHNFKRKRYLKINHNKEDGKYICISFNSLQDWLTLFSNKCY